MQNKLKKANNILLLSIKPKFVDMLLNGSKTTELRRVKPRVIRGDIILIYETSPTMALVGYGIVDSVTAENPKKLWNMVGNLSGITKFDFEQYYIGADIGYGINVSKVKSFLEPISLRLLRNKIKGFQPPQCYRYLCPNQVSAILFTS